MVLDQEFGVSEVCQSSLLSIDYNLFNTIHAINYAAS